MKSIIGTDAWPTRMLVALLGVCCLASAGSAADVYFEDFDADDGGYTEMLYNPVSADGAGTNEPWTWGATGVDGSNAWSVIGGLGGSNPFEHLLDGPEITIPATGRVILEFDHAYRFEEDWDGGVVMFSLNGGDLTPVTNFVANGYNDQMQTGSDWGYEGDMNGLDMFSIRSDGFVHSIADLGSLNTGDTLELQFRGGWDWGTIGGPAGEPEWIIDNVAITQIDIPGDFNYDGNVDMLDFDILSANFNGTGQYSDGDLNLDGKISMVDFVDWFAILDSPATAAVPEPAAWAWLIISPVALCCRRRRNG